MTDDLNLLLVSPSPMPLAEQETFFRDGNTARLPDFSVPLGLIEPAAYVRQRVDRLRLELLDVAKDLHAVYQAFLRGTADRPARSTEFYQREIDSVALTPDIVGISILYSTSYYSCLELARLAKQKWPHALVVCGGNHASAYHTYMLRHPQIDLVFRGEAEMSLTAFLHAFQALSDTPDQQRDPRSYVQLAGVYDREKSVTETGPAQIGELVQDLDEIGVPAYDLLDLDFYLGASHLWDGISVMWSRGCPFKCTFCASFVVHDHPIRHKSNDRIVEELRFVQGLGARVVTIYDDLFAAKRTKFLELETRLTAEGFPEHLSFRLPNSLSVAVMTEEVVDAIGRIGVQYYRVAVESGSKYTQDHLIDKHVNLDKCRRILRYMRSTGRPVEANFILGFPGETRALMQETINFIHSIDVDWVLINAALPLPGTPIFHQFAAMGLIDPETFDWDMNRQPLRNFDTPEIGKDDLSQLVYDTNISYNFFHNSNIKHGRFDRAIHYFDTMVIERYPFHVVGLYCRALAYEGKGDVARATEDFRICVERIRTNEQARRMYQRYGDRMPRLDPFFEDDEVYLAGVDSRASVLVLPTVSGT